MPYYIININDIYFHLTKQDILIINSIKKQNLGHRIIKIKGINIDSSS